MMPFKSGWKVKKAPERRKSEPDVVVDYIELKATTSKAVLFTFEVIDKERHTVLVDKWMPKKFIQVDEEKKKVSIARWLYLSEWGHQYG